MTNFRSWKRVESSSSAPVGGRDGCALFTISSPHVYADTARGRRPRERSAVSRPDRRFAPAERLGPFSFSSRQRDVEENLRRGGAGYLGPAATLRAGRRLQTRRL